MSRQEESIEKWRSCFEARSWSDMLQLCTDDIARWEVGSPRRTHGKQEFQPRVMQGPDVTKSTDRIDRMVEEANLVVTKGEAAIIRKDSSSTKVRDCDTFEIDGEKVKRIAASGSVV